MEGSTLPPFPHYTWFAHALSVHPPQVFAHHEQRHVMARLLLTMTGDADVTWTTRGIVETVHVGAGDIGFYPCDGAVHGLAITSPAGYRGYMLLLPGGHVCGGCGPGGSLPRRSLDPLPVFRDGVMLACLQRLAAGIARRGISEDVGDEIAARQVVSRLWAVAGAGEPAWRSHSSCFTAAVMREIVARVDEGLAARHSLANVSRGFGLSPSHFAKKFRNSTGLSLNRFINTRRVGEALALLGGRSVPLAQLSLDLGFCSQSHFTRSFRGMTGLTPHKFGRLRHPRER